MYCLYVNCFVFFALSGARSQEFHSPRHSCCGDVTIKVIWFDLIWFELKDDKRKILPLLDGFDISFLQVLSLSHLNFNSLWRVTCTNTWTHTETRINQIHIHYSWQISVSSLTSGQCPWTWFSVVMSLVMTQNTDAPWHTHTHTHTHTHITYIQKTYYKIKTFEFQIVQSICCIYEQNFQIRTSSNISKGRFFYT